MFKSYTKLKTGLLCIILLASAIILDSCQKDDVNKSGTTLLSYGPSPLERGEEMMFVGTGLDKVTSIILPDNIEITTFKTQTAELIVLVVPQEVVAGKVVLKTASGTIEAKSLLGIRQPITIDSITPSKLRPQEVITIKGTYLNLVKSVTFSKGRVATTFESQSRTEIKVKVPADAETGLVVISDMDTIAATEVESKTAVEITLPAITSITPATVKAGAQIKITGTDLDLVKKVTFGGDKIDTNFVSQSATEIVVNVPVDAQDGAIKVTVASLLTVESPASLVLMLPTIATLSPNPVKNGGTITVTGTNLDLINKVTFGGSKVGTIEAGGSLTSIVVNVPVDAVNGAVAFQTKALKAVSSPSDLSFIKPVPANISPASVQSGVEITVTGTNLDLVKAIEFSGGTKVTISDATETTVLVTVPLGTTTGHIKLIAKNGDVAESSQTLTILSNVPIISNLTLVVKPGNLLTITGTKLNLVEQVIFADDVKATEFGNRTATTLEVTVPAAAKKGKVKIKLITFEDEQTLTPEITITGADPVVDESLVFFDFNGTGSKDFWWNDAGAIENDADISLDGSSYFRVTGSHTNWTGLFWRNGKNNFPANTIGTSVNGYVLKFDLNVLEPITGGVLKLRLKGTSGDFWYSYNPWADSGSFETDGWITVSIPISDFKDGTTGITDMSTIDSDFGMAFDSGTSIVNAAFDNVRFEELP